MFKNAPHYVLTGGPCAGKTTTVEALAKRGYKVSPEPGRLYIESELSSGKTWDDLRADVPALERGILLKHIELERQNRHDGYLFFDRGIPDCLAYYRFYGVPETEELWRAIRNAPYRKVFLLEPLEYAKDAARQETPEEARAIHQAIEKAYREVGHYVVEVPVMSVEERVDFIVARL